MGYVATNVIFDKNMFPLVDTSIYFLIGGLGKKHHTIMEYLINVLVVSKQQMPDLLWNGDMKPSRSVRTSVSGYRGIDQTSCMVLQIVCPTAVRISLRDEITESAYFLGK